MASVQRRRQRGWGWGLSRGQVYLTPRRIVTGARRQGRWPAGRGYGRRWCAATFGAGRARHMAHRAELHASRRRMVRGCPGCSFARAAWPSSHSIPSSPNCNLSTLSMPQSWDAASGRLLVTMIILPAGKAGQAATEWIAFTPEGYYSGSPGAALYIRWRVGDKLLPAESYAREFNRPERIRHIARFSI